MRLGRDPLGPSSVAAHGAALIIPPSVWPLAACAQLISFCWFDHSVVGNAVVLQYSTKKTGLFGVLASEIDGTASWLSSRVLCLS